MFKVTYASLVAVVAVSMGVGSRSYAGETDMLREANDRAEIQALMWRYVRALDSLDEHAYAQAFTEDGQFGVGSNAEKGRPALMKMITDLKKGRADREASGAAKTPPMYHVITNAYIEFVDKDHARYHSYWMTVFGAAGKGTAPRVAAAGQGVDDVVRIKGQWLIKLRNVAVQD